MEQYDVDEELSSQTVFCVNKHMGLQRDIKVVSLVITISIVPWGLFVVEKSEELFPLKDLEEKSKVG